MKKSGLTQGDRSTGKVELWGVELSAIDCTHIYHTSSLILCYKFDCENLTRNLLLW